MSSTLSISLISYERIKSELKSANVKLANLQDNLMQAKRHGHEMVERNKELTTDLDNALQENTSLKGEIISLKLQVEIIGQDSKLKRNWLVLMVS